jgi:hypothetical protein
MFLEVPITIIEFAKDGGYVKTDTRSGNSTYSIYELYDVKVILSSNQPMTGSSNLDFWTHVKILYIMYLISTSLILHATDKYGADYAEKFHKASP